MNNDKFVRERVELMKNIGLINPDIDTEQCVEVVNLVLSEQEDKNNKSDLLLEYNDEILDIVALGDMETVDISVTGDQLFYCNGILTKNSMGIAHVSDVILSIFQTEEDMELGLVKLGMIKNRYGPRGMVQPMCIDYETLSISQSEESEELMDDEELSVLERLSKN
jgi:hypothetical protein